MHASDADARGTSLGARLRELELLLVLRSANAESRCYELKLSYLETGPPAATGRHENDTSTKIQAVPACACESE